MKHVFSVCNKKFVLAFLLTLLIGLWAGGLFEAYVLRFGIVQNFSTAEAENLAGKTVSDVCYERQMQKPKTGKITGYSRDKYFFVRVRIEWDEKTSGIYAEYPKSYFSNCIEIAE
jgi:hypothetical protein